ncbi:ArsC/Spx/MgsR family protein [Flavobacterium wongokense]|uniref:ArsC/Spx/MgsR family protein n=1 Tax=Flavobacterium wongokense TaxID=2910674 RepID=UPI001F280520|nr:ArsC/Spx/MgsR family protein [Flavobacterium sp. WG47]MCF6132270.1 arsenate reductase [Flavobacterium sp. WG47]
MLQILHNPRCGKSRDCLLFTTETATPFEIINYIENPLTVDELKALIKKLKVKPIEIIRQKEPIWIDKYQGRKLTNAQIIKAIAKYPILMQRPIVIDGDKAIIGREIDKLEAFLK